MQYFLKRMAALLLFWVLFAAFFFEIQRIIIPKFGGYPDTSEQKKYVDYELLEPNSIDVLFVGASNSYTNIYPMELYGKYGYAGFSMGTAHQTVMQTYYMLKYVSNSHNIMFCIMDPVALFYDEKYTGDDDAKYEEIMNYFMPFSDEKIHLVDAYYDTMTEKFLSIFPLFRFHDRWSDLDKTDFTFWSNNGETIYYGANYSVNVIPYLGFSMVQTENTIYMEDEYEQRFFTDVQAQTDKLRQEWAALPISEENRVYFDKIVSFCHDRGIQLILVKTPDKVSWNKNKYEKLMDFMTEYNDIPVVDMEFGDCVSEINWSIDTRDGGRHLNYRGGLKSTATLGEWMNENLSLEDHRGQEKYASWDRDYADYLIAKERLLKAMMSDAERIDALFERLNEAKEHSVIVASVRNDMSTFWNDHINEQMTGLGFVNDFYDRRQQSYIGVVDCGDVVFDVHDKSSLIYRGTFECDGLHSLEVTSEGYGVGDSCSVKIDGVECSSNGVGINFVIYDKNLGKVTEVASINTTRASFTISEKQYEGE